MTAKLIPVGDWNSARFSPPVSAQILRRGWHKNDGLGPVTGAKEWNDSH